MYKGPARVQPVLRGLFLLPSAGNNAGAGARASPGASAPFTYYPRCAALSTQYPDVRDVLQATSSLVQHGPGGGGGGWLQRAAQGVARWAQPSRLLTAAPPLDCG